MFFIGGGGFGGPGCRFRGQYPRAAKKPLKTPPKPPPFFNFGSGGGFKHDIRFPRTPPPPCCCSYHHEGKAIRVGMGCRQRFPGIRQGIVCKQWFATAIDTQNDFVH